MYEANREMKGNVFSLDLFGSDFLTSKQSISMWILYEIAGYCFVHIKIHVQLYFAVVGTVQEWKKRQM